MLAQQEALTLCEEILDLIDEDVPEEAWAKKPEFFESVQEKVKSMMETIENRPDVTTRQAEALENMKAGVEKWIH